MNPIARAVALGLLVVAVCGCAPSEEATGKASALQAPGAPKAQDATATPESLGFTIQDYQRELIAVAAGLDVTEFNARPESMPAGAGVATIRMRDGASVALAVDDETGQVMQTTFTGYATPSTNAMQLIALSAVSIHAAFQPQQREQLKAELGKLFGGLQIDGPTHQALVGDKKVSALLSSTLGYVAVVEPAE